MWIYKLRFIALLLSKRKKCNAVANSAPNHINLQFSVAKNGPPKNIINTKSTIIEYLETFF